MRILHIFTDTNYSISEDFIQFINKQFSKEEHTFLYLNKNNKLPNSISKHPNVVSIDISSNINFSKFTKILNSHDKFLLHGLFYRLNLLMWFLLRPRYFKKIVWVAWGGDLYKSKKTNKKLLKNMVVNIVKNAFRKRIRYFVGIFPPDIEYYKSEFNSNSKTSYASYAGNLNNAFYEKDLDLITLENKRENKKTINIQVGHSATPILNHLDVLRDLEKYKEENIRIFLPLSYGDKHYGDKVEEKSIQIFGNKAISMRKMMSKEKYMNFLSEMDIIIFNTHRQIGLGNITPLLYTKKKLYMPEDSVMYNFYRTQGIEINDYYKIKNIDFSEFINSVNMDTAEEYVINNELNKSKKIEMWSKVFNAPIE